MHTDINEEDDINCTYVIPEIVKVRAHKLNDNNNIPRKSNTSF